MAQDLAYENPDFVYLATIRTINSRLWFIHNRRLERGILAFLAKYSEMYGVVVYGFILMGNHYHLLAKFPRGNKSAFFRAFNAIVAKLTCAFVKEFDGGKLWARRVRVQALTRNEDVLHWFFYVALNPVKSGVSQTLSEFGDYNSFNDAAHGQKRRFKIVDWKDYNNRKRFNKKLTPDDCAKLYSLEYARLPGFDGMSQADYCSFLECELERRREALVLKRKAEGKGFAAVSTMLRTVPGAKPRSTKKSNRDSKRPLILTLCARTRKIFLNWYFSMLESYRRASKAYRRGMLEATFPPYTHRPPVFSH